MMSNNMNNIFLKITCILAISCMVGCQSYQNSVQEISVCYNNTLASSSDLIDSISIIKPEVNGKKSIIGSIDRILLSEDGLFIVDRKNNQLSSFDLNGNFVKSTEHIIGNGRNEYVRILDASIDTSDSLIYIYCDAPYKIMTLNFKLDVINTYQLDDLFTEIAICGNNLYALCLNQERNRMELRKYEKKHPNGNYQLELIQEDYIQGVKGIGKSMTSGSRSLFVSMPFSNKIRKIDENGLVSDSSIDFGEMWFDYSESNNHKGTSFIDKNADRIWMLMNISSSDSTLLFNTNKTGLICSNMSGKAVVYSEIIDDDFPFTSTMVLPIGGKDGFVSMIVPCSMIMKYKEYCKKNNKELSINDTTYEQIINSFKESDNPLIVVAKIR